MSYASTHCTPSSYLPLQLPTAPSTALPRQRATHFRSCTSQIHSTVTASSFPRVGTVGERPRCYAMALTRKLGARHGSSTSFPSLMSTGGAEQAHGNSTRRSCRIKARRHASLPTGFPPRTLGLTPTAIADPAPAVQQSNAGTSLPR